MVGVFVCACDLWSKSRPRAGIFGLIYSKMILIIQRSELNGQSYLKRVSIIIFRAPFMKK